MGRKCIDNFRYHWKLILQALDILPGALGNIFNTLCYISIKILNLRSSFLNSNTLLQLQMLLQMLVISAKNSQHWGKNVTTLQIYTKTSILCEFPALQFIIYIVRFPFLYSLFNLYSLFSFLFTKISDGVNQFA